MIKLDYILWGIYTMVREAFANMKVKKVIVHQVYARDYENNPKEPFYSSECIPRNKVFGDKLKAKIIKSLGRESHSIQMQIKDDGEESIYKYITEYWGSSEDDEAFICLSRKVADSLVVAQKSRIYPDCLVICIEGIVQENKEFFCIVKAESQDGFSLHRDAEKIDLNYLDNLVMTKNEKFQKIGMFIKKIDGNNNITANLVDAYIFDSNTNESASKAKATYFYSNFLGLDFRDDSNRLTLKFFEKTKEFINSRDDIQDIEKINLSTDLVKYIMSEEYQMINVADFSKNIESPSLRDEYINFLIENEVPANNILKDTSMIGRPLKYRKLHFENNVQLQIPTDSFSDVVTISKDDASGETVITIKGMMLNEK